MNVQYISDSNGLTTGVFIPIKEWNNLKAKFTDLVKEEGVITDRDKQIIRDRFDEYKKNPTSATHFDSAISEIENEL